MCIDLKETPGRRERAKNSGYSRGLLWRSFLSKSFHRCKKLVGATFAKMIGRLVPTITLPMQACFRLITELPCGTRFAAGFRHLSEAVENDAAEASKKRQERSASPALPAGRGQLGASVVELNQ